MLGLITLLPFLGAALSTLSRKTSASYAAQTACLLVGASLLLSLPLAAEAVLRGAVVALPLADLYPAAEAALRLDLVLGANSAVLSVVVCRVSFAVHLYSLWYMEGDPHTAHFFGLISLFTGIMLVTATGGTLLTLFLGWEGIGVVSYLLVAYWSSRLAAVSSAVQAFLLNRAGDLALTLALAAALALTGGTAFGGLAFGAGGTDALVVLLLVAAAGKSAQLGLHAWLPNAMEAPTPVSALIHAATLVTAGVFLLVQCAPLLAGGSATAVAALLGATTTVFAGVVGLGQMDLKRVIAFSTCSQIALVLLAVGTGQFTSGLALLALHAAYKAALFLGAGMVIHGMAGVQDLRSIGGLGAVMPAASSAMLVAAAALCALPYTSGEFGKDLLVVGAAGRGLLLDNTAWWLAVASIGLTVAYSVRLHRLAFGGAPRAPLHALLGAPEAGLGGAFYPGGVAVALLAALSLGAGYLLSAVFLPSGGVFNGGTPWTRALDDEASAAGLTVCAPYLLGLLGALLGYAGGGSGALSVAGVAGFAALSSRLFCAGLDAARITSQLLDRGLFEAVGPYGASSLLAGTAVRARQAVFTGGLGSRLLLSMLFAVAGGAGVLATGLA